MSRDKSKLQISLYRLFLVCCTLGSVLGLLLIWGVELSTFWLRVLGTSAVVALASAFTMSATRLVSGRPAEDDGG